MLKRLLLLFLGHCLLTVSARAQSFPPDKLREATITSLHTAMQHGKLTATELVQRYLDRIEAYDKQGPFINALILINPKALAEAHRLDSIYRVTGKFVGPLHGIPVIVKDNYDTYDMPTTNGTLAMKNSIPPDDAFVVRKIREAGAIIIAKSNLAEFAQSGNFFRQFHPAGLLAQPLRHPAHHGRFERGNSRCRSRRLWYHWPRHRHGQFHSRTGRAPEFGGLSVYAGPD